MTEYVMRFLSMLVARLLAQAKRLARLVAVRHEVTQCMVMSTNEEMALRGIVWVISWP